MSGKKPNGGKIRADGPHWGRHSGCPRDSVRLRASEGKKKFCPGHQVMCLGGSRVALWGIDLN